MSILSKLNILNLRYKNFLLTPISWFGLTLPPHACHTSENVPPQNPYPLCLPCTTSLADTNL